MHENYVRCKLGSLNGKNYYLCKKNCSCSIVTTNKQIRKCIGKLVKIYVFFIQKKKYEKFGKCYLLLEVLKVFMLLPTSQYLK